MSRKISTSTKTMTQTTDSEEISYNIIDVNSWNPTEHICGNAKPNKSGQGKTAPITYQGKKFYLKTPKMFCQFPAGQSTFKQQAGEKEKENKPFSLQLVFSDTPECRLFQQKAEEFDEFMVKQAMEPEHGFTWLGFPKQKQPNIEVVRSKYNKMVRRSKNKETGEEQMQYPPSLRVAFPTNFKNPTEFNCEFYDKSNQPIMVSMDSKDTNFISKIIPGGCSCSALLIASIWCTGTGYGVSWKVQQIKVFPPRDSIPKGKCLVNDPDDSDEEERNEKKSKGIDKEVDEEDDEDKNEEVSDPEEVDVEDINETDIVSSSAPAPNAEPVPTNQTGIRKLIPKNK